MSVQHRSYGQQQCIVQLKSVKRVELMLSVPVNKIFLKKKKIVFSLILQFFCTIEYAPVIVMKSKTQS